MKAPLNATVDQLVNVLPNRALMPPQYLSTGVYWLDVLPDAVSWVLLGHRIRAG